MSKSVTIYNGTFRKLNGENRTMRFVRQTDLPTSMVNTTRINELQERTKSEVVYDIDKRAFRQFNWNTTQGDVTETAGTFTF
tara:strand:+ start:36 stop:281 length:246 start_codon:yes stop_codon:yes gene_type:complete